MTYLGTAGFIFSSEDRHIVVDPFVTRPSKGETLLRPLRSDPKIVSSLIPKADDVIIGHSHHDHILDAPELCIQTGARFIGSPDSCRVARAAYVPEKQIISTKGREDIQCGQNATVRAFPSLHGRVYFNRVSMPGRIADDFSWPSRLSHFRHGLVLNWLIEIEGIRIFHIDSADFIEEELENIEAVDVLCLCAIGRNWRKNYVEDAVRLLRPKMIVACHWDCFWQPFHAQQYLLPSVDLEGFVADIEKAGVEPAVVPLGGTITL